MSKKLLQAAAGAGGEALTVEDVFSTYLYTGNGIYSPISGVNNIQNGVDLDGEGGLVWCRARNTATTIRNMLFDTERGISKPLYSERADAEGNYAGRGLTSFNSDGFTLESNLFGENYNTAPCVSWTFRKAEKFFDVVTFTAPASGGATVSHNLGSVPACIIIKATSSTGAWYTYHESVATKYLMLNNSNAAASFQAFTNITDSSFDVASGLLSANASYVAYLFASDAGGFGDDDESIIKCGSAAATGLTTVDCGFEPQWVLIKSATVSNSWYIFDSMRGLHATGVGPQTLNPNLSGAEYTESADTCNLTSTGFTFNSARFNGNATYIYIAIRRPMKTPESGTEVFDIDAYAGNDATRILTSSNTTDLGIIKSRTTSNEWIWSDRLRGATKTIYSNATLAEATESGGITGFDVQTGIEISNGAIVNYIGRNYISYMLKRATGFFDVVAYTGDGVAGRTVAHNLGVAPEMIVIKRRESVRDWGTGFDSLGWTMRGPAINSTEQAYTTSLWWNNTAPTNTEFTLGTSATTNGSSGTYIAYLFATLAGVSKVGSYTGTGTTQTIDCGFSNGARFVLIKSTTYSSGNWFVFDTERGITTTAPTSPFLTLNSTSAESASSVIEPDPTGFKIIATGAGTNGVGNSYIFLAIA